VNRSALLLLAMCLLPVAAFAADEPKIQPVEVVNDVQVEIVNLDPFSVEIQEPLQVDIPQPLQIEIVNTPEPTKSVITRTVLRDANGELAGWTSPAFAETQSLVSEAA
jgi:hypothetical protein